MLRVQGEPVSKLILDPDTEENSERWQNMIALACDPEEPEQEAASSVTADAASVVDSAVEFDALQLFEQEGEKADEREVRVDCLLLAVRSSDLQYLST